LANIIGESHAPHIGERCKPLLPRGVLAEQRHPTDIEARESQIAGGKVDPQPKAEQAAVGFPATQGGDSVDQTATDADDRPPPSTTNS